MATTITGMTLENFGLTDNILIFADGIARNDIEDIKADYLPLTGGIMTGNILPSSTSSNISLGTTDFRWRNIYGVNYYATTAFYQDSDARLKNVHGEIDLDKAYDLIEKCSTILYDLKDDEEHKVNIGVIAQEIQEFFPEIISEKEDGMLSVDYSKLTVIIMRVLKDLIERVKKLEK